ncbi:MAG: VanZ family protein, partial [Bacteroidota bacterium]
MKNRLIPAVFFLAYAILLLKIMVFKDLPMIRIGQLHLNFGGTQEGEANYIPFKTIWFYLIGSRGLLIGGINILGNILLLVPLGYLMPFAFPGLSWKKMLLAAMLICVAIEGSQVLLKVGIWDVDDILLNFMGFLIGYDAGRRIQRWTPSKITKQIGLAISLCLIVGLGFYLQTDQFPIGFEKEVQHLGRETMGKNAEALADLCGGTGGTGIIQAKGKDFIEIVRKDGVV